MCLELEFKEGCEPQVVGDGNRTRFLCGILNLQSLPLYFHKARCL